MLFVIFALYCQGTISVSMLFIFDCFALHRFNSCTKLVIFGLFCVLFGNKMHLICIFEQKSIKMGGLILTEPKSYAIIILLPIFTKNACASQNFDVHLRTVNVEQ